MNKIDCKMYADRAYNMFVKAVGHNDEELQRSMIHKLIKHLYNRSIGKEGYSVVNYHQYCFRKCTLMPDYSSIPSDWK